MAADRDRGAVGGHVQQVHHPVASSVDVPHAGLGWRLHRICPPGQRGGVQQQVGDCGEPLVKGARPGPRCSATLGKAGSDASQPRHHVGGPATNYVGVFMAATAFALIGAFAIMPVRGTR
jgi:hypothetical protein